MTCLPFPDKKPDARLDLVCLHYAGGGSAVFRGWDARFPDWIAVRPVELPGRGTRMAEPLEHDPDALVDRLCAELSPHLRRPWALFGHSLGAALGYRIALRFQGEGRPPLAVFPSGRHGPAGAVPVRRRAHLPDDALLAEVRGLNGSPPEVLENRELMRLMLPIIRADFRLSEAVSARPLAEPLACPLLVFGGADDPEVPRDALRHWRLVAGGAFDVALLPGDHFFLHHPAQADALRDRIVAALTPLLPPRPRQRQPA
ncbi:medium-chain acyl-[acyl-carrier-protein] hydrolase [Azospirillum agricola]|uniref:thioesterase II family protein n=1 Tax=Azospirillum agricola TaxID=1720247 RepID=UPI001AE66A69|nr:thioesterase domain-containing protein [Azospirillum agricola]MBP2231650.1 medium-chain acyl-[acyl-carrier-protein] hydrolase [Azospirillum agricola]